MKLTLTSSKSMKKALGKTVPVTAMLRASQFGTDVWSAISGLKGDFRDPDLVKKAQEESRGLTFREIAVFFSANSGLIITEILGYEEGRRIPMLIGGAVFG